MSVEEYKLDVIELDGLLNTVTRPSIKKILLNERQQLNTLIEKASTPSVTPSTPTVSPPTTKTSSLLPTVKISNYGWDESDKFVKLYITLNGVHNSPPEDVVCSFTPNSLDLSAIVNGKKYEMSFKDLLNEIDVDASTCKQKTDMITLMCKKAEVGKKWQYLTKTEKMVKDKSKPKFDADSAKDPQESLMGLMKQMYDDGDDEMKRTIRKSWHESQNKKNTMGMEDMGLGL